MGNDLRGAHPPDQKRQDRNGGQLRFPVVVVKRVTETKAILDRHRWIIGDVIEQAHQPMTIIGQFLRQIMWFATQRREAKTRKM